MGVFDFLRTRPVTAEELEPYVRGAEKARREAMMRLRKLAARRRRMLGKAQKARAAKDEIELEYAWQELKSLRAETAYAKREAQVATLEEIALKRYWRGVKRLEEKRDVKSMRRLFERMRESGLEAKLRGEHVDEQAYMEELNAILAVVGEEVEAIESEEDEEKAEFLKSLDAIIEAEKTGDKHTARELKQRLERQLEHGEQEAGD